MAFTYPGVYIEEISSGQHTITGVATSIAAFVGWAPQGPINEAVMVESFAEYQARYGTFVPGISLAYAVNQFFQNGGSQAYIVRIVDSTTAAVGTNTIGGLVLYASNPGGWSSSIFVTISNVSGGGTTFNLLLTNASGLPLESYTNLSLSSTSPQYVVTVINSDSNFLTFTPPTGPMAALPATVTAAGPTALSGGADGTQLIPGLASGAFETALDITDALTPIAPGATPLPGLSLLNAVPIFNLLCVPGETDAPTIAGLQRFCQNNRAFFIVDAPQNATLQDFQTNYGAPIGTITASPFKQGLSGSAPAASYSGYYYPWVLAPDPAMGNRPALYPPCGIVAGQFAATDASRGVWKAPAGIATTLSQVLGLQVNLSDAQNGTLNPIGVNCLRQFRNTGNVIWGSRTLAGADVIGSEWKYIPIRRMALFLESSLYDGTQWVVFEPNAEPLWGQIRMNVGTFMQEQFLAGAFAGSTPQQAYFVKCDSDNNPGSSIALGIVNITVGFAPLYPAEFVVIQITQMLNN